ncbi:hypothetical protein OROGR_027320 [Orobanche gracilis]
MAVMKKFGAKALSMIKAGVRSRSMSSGVKSGDSRLEQVKNKEQSVGGTGNYMEEFQAEMDDLMKRRSAMYRESFKRLNETTSKGFDRIGAAVTDGLKEQSANLQQASRNLTRYGVGVLLLYIAAIGTSVASKNKRGKE